MMFFFVCLLELSWKNWFRLTFGPFAYQESLRLGFSASKINPVGRVETGFFQP